MIRVALIVNDLKWGAVTALIYDLVSQGNRDTFNFFIINLASKEDQGVEIFENIGIKVISLNTAKHAVFKQALYLYQKIKAFKPLLCHAHMGRAILLASSVARLAGVKKIVCTNHTVLSGYSKLTRIGIRLLGRFNDYSVFVSPTVAKSFSKIASIFRRGYVINNTIDIDRFRNNIDSKKLPLLKQDLDLNGKKIVIATVGRLIKAKNHLFAIDVIARLKERESNFIWLIIGTGPLFDTIQSEVKRRGITHWVNMLGFRHDLPTLIQVVDVVFNPSIWEGLSITMIETMAMAKVFIGSDIPQFSDFIANGVNGFTIPLSEPEKFAEVLFYLAQDSEKREQIGQNAFRTVVTKFSIEEMRCKYFELYRNLIERDIKVD